jgi:hypothetical protein
VFGLSWLNVLAVINSVQDTPVIYQRFQVNHTCTSLTDQVRSVNDIAAAVTKGDLTQKMVISGAGEMAILKRTLNSMIDQLSGFATEVTILALGMTEGETWCRERVKGLQGTWADVVKVLDASCLS